MAIRDALLPEFDHEFAGARKCLERLPADKFDFTPHPKSWPLRRLAAHVATIADWASITCEQADLDMSVKRAPSAPMNSAAELVARLDDVVAKGRAAIASTDDAKMMELWTLKSGDHVVFTLPRAAVLRSFVLNHLIHHRAQLTIYMRMLDVPVPGLYGPSADEQ
jgi:uncharacterized damage-inducible protein DinB